MNETATWNLTKLVLSTILLLFVFGSVAAQDAPQRMSDKDVTTLMNLTDDAKKFRSSFDSAVKESTVRGTTREKDAKGLVEEFVKQTGELLDQFKSRKTAAKVKTEMEQLGAVFGASASPKPAAT